MARNVDGKQLFCLTVDNQNKNFLPRNDKDGPPMVQFADMDRDGMMDAYFYQNGLIYVYYNRLSRKTYSSGLGESYLCLKQDEADTGSVFQNYYELTDSQLMQKGSEFVTIQDIQAMTRFPIKKAMPGLSSAPRGRIRAADINIDGLPDLFLTLELQKKDGSTFPKSYVFLAEPCDESKCNKKAANHKAYGDEFPRTYFAKGASINGIDSAKITDKAGD